MLGVAPTGHEGGDRGSYGAWPGPPGPRSWPIKSRTKSQPAKSLQESLQGAVTQTSRAGAGPGLWARQGQEDRVVSQAGDHPETARTWGCGRGGLAENWEGTVSFSAEAPYLCVWL